MYRKWPAYFALILVSIISQTVYSDSGTYQGAYPGPETWNENSNWTGATYPQSTGDAATINAIQDLTLNVTSGITLESITYNPNDVQGLLTYIKPENNATITFDAGKTNITFPDSQQGQNNRFLFMEPTLVLTAGTHTINMGENTQNSASQLEVYSITKADAGETDLVIEGRWGEFTWYNPATNQNNISSISIPNGGGSLFFNVYQPVETNAPSIDVDGGNICTFDLFEGIYSGDISGVGTVYIGGSLRTPIPNITLSGALTNTGTLEILGGRLNLSAPPAFSTINLSGENGGNFKGDLYMTINTNDSYSGEIQSYIDISGDFHKLGTAILTLDGVLGYSGKTYVEGGTLELVSTPTSTSSIILSNSATLDFAPTGSETLSAPITGAGSVTMSGAGTLTLSGTDLSYTGNTAVTGGTLSLVKSPSATPQISITAAKTLQFAPASGDSQTFAGVITGAGAVIMNGEGVQNLSGASTYTGATTVSQGTLNLNSGAALLSDITLNSGSSAASTAILSGSGSITGTVTATKGFVEVGPTTSSTLSTGVYSQSTNSTLKVPISRESAGKLAVIGDATLDGTLEVDFQPGTYPAGTSYTVLTATGALNDTAFDLLVEGTSGTWNITYTDDNTVTVSTPTGAQTHPVPISSLRGNERSVADYMYDDQSFVHSNADLTEVSHAMNILPAAEFEDSFLRVSSLAYAAQDGALLFGDVQMAQTFDPYSRGGSSQGASLALVTETSEDTDYLLAEQTLLNTPAGNAAFEETSSTPCLEASKSTRKKKIFQMPCFAITSQGAFIQPIGIYYNQREKEQQVPFDMGTYGVGAGWTQVFGDQFFLTAGVGYTHSNLDWKNNYGNSNWSTVYVAPVVGWFGNRAFANLTVMGAFNFIKADRRIVFPGINRVAKSRYNAYDLLLKGNGGMRFAVFDFIPRSWFQPEVTLNYLTIFTEEYTESGANSINLNVQKRTNYLLQPSFRAKLIKEVITKKYCYAPSLYVGWLANIPLNADNMQARFTGAPNQTLFNITGYNQTTNQLILGAGFFMKRAEKFELQSDFEVDMLSKYEIYNFKVNFQWLF